MSVLYQGFQAVIGLEVHAQIHTASKLFSGAPSDVFGRDPNTCVSLVDLAMPGMLPVVNRACVEQGVRLGLAIGGTIHLTSVFERKHYFYPDNPAGYQISQYLRPLVENGHLTISDHEGNPKVVRLQRIHLEQDAGKLLHDQDPQRSFVDFNRAGVALMEIVSHPDLNTPEEVVSYVKTLRALVRALGVCQGDMEKGHLRVDANVSVRRPGAPLGTRVELKNMNSTRFLQQALVYEIDRHIRAIQEGKPLVQETRTFDPATGVTRTMRLKEDATDYFYFPDPDLLPVVLMQEEVDAIAKTLPETPEAKKQRFVSQWGLTNYDASVLVEDADVARFFQDTVAHLAGAHQYKLAANWMLGEVFAFLKRMDQTLEQTCLTPQHLAELVQAIAAQEVSGSLAKEVFAVMMDTGQMPRAIMQERGWVQVLDEGQVQQWIDAVLQGDPGQVAQYLAGKDKLMGYFVGQVMKASAGKANPGLVQQVLTRTFDAMRRSS